MKRFRRPPLPSRTAKDLARNQRKTDTERMAGTLDVAKTWKSARRTKTLARVLAVLHRMAGARQRCMYCGDSHGTDIDHFWPKRRYPERMFSWPNHLLSCTECGRHKGDRFPVSEGAPLLVDPTAEDPWRFLDFDPKTGNVTARFDPTRDVWFPKGQATVDLLRLDRREALSAGRLKSYRRLVSWVSDAIASGASQDRPDPSTSLLSDDDHGLLGWCFLGLGREVEPFATLRIRHPDIWHRCLDAIASQFADRE